jgi:phosphoribosylformimino-5-aminoimidazole carboxamide ribotide isomerase
MSAFDIIPVLDLKEGVVVRARAGDRANYRPIETPLAADSRPSSVLAGLLRLAPFRIIYIADLDAIAGAGDHRAAIRALADAASGVQFWIDAGFAMLAAAEAFRGTRIVPVFGSESLADGDALAAAKEALGCDRLILSLDYRGARFLGPAEIERRPELWPDRVILMTLARVGTSGGPDIDALKALLRRAGPRQVFAAGGVRGDDDIAALKAAGISGALVATALHDGRLSAAALSASDP